MNTLMDEKKYLLDGKPVSAWTLIEEAARLSHSYAERGFCTSSEAAGILRDAGRTVENKKDKEDNDE